MCILSLIIIFLRFLFYLTILYLLPKFLAYNMSDFGSVFDVNVSYIVNGDFNNFRSFLFLCNNPVHVDVQVYLNEKFYDHNFQLTSESNSNIFKLEILFSVFSLKHNHELRIKIFV